MKLKLFCLMMISVLIVSIVTPIQSFAYEDENGIDYQFEMDDPKEVGDEDIDYKITERSEYKYYMNTKADALKKEEYVEEFNDFSDESVTHYLQISDIILSTIKTKKIIISKGMDIDLAKKIVETNNKKYKIDLSDARWYIYGSDNSKYIEVNDGKCSVLDYPDKERTITISATVAIKIEGAWRKVVVYFYVTIKRNAATMDKAINVPEKNKKTMKIQNNSLKDKTVTWTSSNVNIAKVNKMGSVTGVRKGECKISATLSDGTKLSCRVFVPSSLEARILNQNKGTYANGSYEIPISATSIFNYVYYVDSLDSKSISGTDIFYVSFYDRATGNYVGVKTFAFCYDKHHDIDCLIWYNTYLPSFDCMYFY